MSIKGIDISSFQGNPDYDVLNKNLDFVITKVTEGVNYLNPNFAYNRDNARRVGMGLGFYHFARPEYGNIASNEADYFLSNIGAMKSGDILCLDYESNFKDCVNWCKKWLDRVYTNSGIKPLIYLNKSTISSFNWQPIIDAGYGLWLADYSYDPNSTVPTTAWKFTAIRQYTDKLAVGGVNGVVDGDVFYGDIDQFHAYGYKPAAPVPPVTSTAPVNDCNDCKQLETAQQTIVDQNISISNMIKTIAGLQRQQFTFSQAFNLLIDAWKNKRW